MFYTQPKLHGKLDAFGKLTKRGKQVVLYEVYDGFGIPLEVLKLVKSVEIRYKGQTYQAGKQDFFAHGVEHDFDGEKQLVLSRKFWYIPEQRKLL